jgi:hypothetical protein
MNKNVKLIYIIQLSENPRRFRLNYANMTDFRRFHDAKKVLERLINE